MSYYKSSKPDWIASPVGIAPRPFIAGGLREWPPRGYIGPTTNYRMPGMSGCGACGGFGQEDDMGAGAAAEFWTGQWAGGAGAAAAQGAAAGAAGSSYETPMPDTSITDSWDASTEPAVNDDWAIADMLSRGTEAENAYETGSDPGDGTEDAAYQEYTSDVTGGGSGQPAPQKQAAAKSGSIFVPVLLGLGLLGLIWITRDKKTRRNAGRGQVARGQLLAHHRAHHRRSRTHRGSWRHKSVCPKCGGQGVNPFSWHGSTCFRCRGKGYVRGATRKSSRR